MALILESIARKVAVHSGADPRTVKRVVAGEKVNPLTRERIVAAMKDLGLDGLLPADGEHLRIRRR
jgi:hypothetical protein